jgi:hypothetical protein
MRRLSLVLAIAAMVLVVPAVTMAAPFPGNGPGACSKAGGTFSVDASTSPATKTCLVSDHNGAVTLWYGGAAGYVVEVSTSDDVTYYIAFGADRQVIPLSGAIAITNCWYNSVPVPAFQSDPNCQPTSPYP